MLRNIRHMFQRSVQDAYTTDSLSGICRETMLGWTFVFLVGSVSWYVVISVGRATGYGPAIALGWLCVLIMSVVAMIAPSAYGLLEESDASARIYLYKRAIPNALATGMMFSFFARNGQHLLGSIVG